MYGTGTATARTVAKKHTLVDIDIIQQQDDANNTRDHPRAENHSPVETISSHT